jgi:hypothetical protein
MQRVQSDASTARSLRDFFLVNDEEKAAQSIPIADRAEELSTAALY